MDIPISPESGRAAARRPARGTKPTAAQASVEPDAIRPRPSVLSSNDRPAGREGAPYQEWAAKKVLESFNRRGIDDPTAQCLPGGLPRSVTLGLFPQQFVQTPTQLVILYEYMNVFRVIPFTATHPDDIIPSYMGNSIARWQGDTLVVDVIGFNDKTWLAGTGTFHSDQLHITERYTRVSRDRIDYEVTMEDPKVLTKPWRLTSSLMLREGTQARGIHMRREQSRSRAVQTAAQKRREVYALAALLLVTAAIGADVRMRAADAGPTFTRDILPILQKNCQSCHRPGQIAPMSLLTYNEARPWARSIKTKVESRQMPPWFADPKHGQFANDRSLSPGDVEAIVKWVDAGAPQGDAADAPPPVAWPADGWQIKPDIVVKGPEFRVPAHTKNDVVEWVTYVVPSGFTRDTWIRR